MPNNETRSGLCLHLAKHIVQITDQLAGRKLDGISRQKLAESQTLLLDASMTIAVLIGAPLKPDDD